MSGQFLEHDALMENVSHPGAFPAHPVQFIRMTAASDRYRRENACMETCQEGRRLEVHFR